MIRNYFIVALRNIARHKLYSIINIAGLAVGLACAILIIVFVREELSYDKWIPDAGNLYRIEVTFHWPGRPDSPTAQTSMPLPVAMREQIPEVRAATRLEWERITMIAGDRRFLEEVGVVDPNFLQVIKLSLVSGNPDTALVQPESAVISQSVASQIFGGADPIGKTISTQRAPCAPNAVPCDNSPVPLKVTGVMRDLPRNSQFYLDMLMPNISAGDQRTQAFKHNWLSTAMTFGYVKLVPGTDPAQVLAKLRPILDRSIDGSSLVGAKIAGSKILEPHLTPLLQAHLTTDRYVGMRPAGSWTTLYGMIVIGVLILLVACFNFMNLGTARAALRAREISMRKCVGAMRAQLVVQFLGESVLISLLALVLALAMAEILLPPYSEFLQVPLSLNYPNDWAVVLGILAIAVLAGLIGGIYPAIVLSGFRPASILRANSSANSGSGTLRSILVVFQFAVAIGFGIAAIVVFEQIEFARHIDLGFRRNNVVVVGTAGQLSQAGMESFASALSQGPGILGVARSDAIAFTGDNQTLTAQKPSDPEVLSPTHLAITPNYFELYGIKILAGRSLSEQRAEDVFTWGAGDTTTPKNEGHNVMVNAVLAHGLGYTPEDIVGQTFIFGHAHMKVVGVAADTLVNGVRSTGLPTVYVYAPEVSDRFSIRIEPERTREAIAYIGRISRTFLPNIAAAPAFLDDSYERLYRADEKQGQIFAIFVAIAIFIACMGLFGLAAFTAGRRTKEIGIRKVFGASVRDVILLLLWQFSLPVLFANAVAWPLVWHYLHGWLQGFAYRISLNPLYFLGSGAVATMVAWATVFVHARRVASTNPIHALRYE